MSNNSERAPLLGKSIDDPVLLKLNQHNDVNEPDEEHNSDSISLYGSTHKNSERRNSDPGTPKFNPQIAPNNNITNTQKSNGNNGSNRNSFQNPQSSPPTVRTEENLFSRHNFMLLVYLMTSIAVAAANSITWKRTLNKFRAVDGSDHNLEFFVNQFTVFLYVVLAAGILAHRWLFTDLITEQQKQYPKRKFAFMGFLDACAGVAGSIGGGATSGQIQTLINQLNIPATMGLSRLTLNTSYRNSQYCGALLIVIGSLVAALPASTNDASSGSRTAFYGPLILILSCIPNSFSNVYKESNFKEDGLDVYYLTTNVSWFQVLIGFCFFPLLSLPGFGGLAMNEMPQNFLDGWKCFLGENLSGYECHISPSPAFVLILYVIVNFVYNVLLLLITKHGSALLLVIASALSLPITNIIFTMPFFMGLDAEDWSMWNVVGLVIVVTGFLLYSLVTDPEGEIMPVQGAAGQNMFILEDAPITVDVRRTRSRSFDATASPAWTLQVSARRKKAEKRFQHSGYAGHVLDQSDFSSSLPL